MSYGRAVDFYHLCPCGCREIIPIYWRSCRAVVIGAGDSPQQGTTRRHRVDSASHRGHLGYPLRLDVTGPDQGAPAPGTDFAPVPASPVPSPGDPGRPPS